MNCKKRTALAGGLTFALVAAVMIVALSGLSAPARADGGAAGNYGEPAFDGVIAAGEYNARYTLTAGNLLALNMDYSPGAAVPEGFRIDLYLSWSERGLCVGFEVLDDTLYVNNAAPYAADQFMLLIDLGPSAQGGTSLKGRTLADSAALGGNRAPKFTAAITDGGLAWMHQWVPGEGFLSDPAAGLAGLFAGRYITEGGQGIGFSGEYLIPWWLLAQDMNQKTGETLFDVEEVAKGTVIGEGFELGITPLYYNYNAGGAGQGQYAHVSSAWFALEPDHAGITLTLAKAAPTDSSSSAQTSATTASSAGAASSASAASSAVSQGTSTSAAAQNIPMKSGNYGEAVVDGVIGGDEYVTRISLTAKDFKGLKFDFSGEAAVEDSLRIDLYLSWTEAGLHVGYEVRGDSTPYFGAPGSYASDQLALMIDLGHSSKGGLSLADKELSDKAAYSGNRAPRFNSFLDSAGTFLWLHQWVPNESNMHLVDGLSELCAGQFIMTDGHKTGFTGEYLIPWWLLADDMNRKLGQTVFDVAEVAKGTVVGEGFELSITPVYYDYNAGGTGTAQYAVVKSDWFALEPEHAGIGFKLTKRDADTGPEEGPATGLGMSPWPLAVAFAAAVTMPAILLRRRRGGC